MLCLRQWDSHREDVCQNVELLSSNPGVTVITWRNNSDKMSNTAVGLNSLLPSRALALSRPSCLIAIVSTYETKRVIFRVYQRECFIR